MKRQAILVTVLVTLLLGILVPSSLGTASAAAPDRSHAAALHTQAHAQAFDKTKFVLHLGVAAFLIHYIYKKYHQGKLSRRHLFTVVKAGVAALVAYHEIRVAYNLAKGSNSKTLQVLISPMTKLSAAMSALGTKLKRGDTSGVDSTYAQTTSFDSLAGKNGYSVKETAPASGPGF